MRTVLNNTLELKLRYHRFVVIQEAPETKEILNACQCSIQLSQSVNESRWIYVLVVKTSPWVKWTIIRIISEFENDYEFVCLVIPRMRSSP